MGTGIYFQIWELTTSNIIKFLVKENKILKMKDVIVKTLLDSILLFFSGVSVELHALGRTRR